MPDVFKAFGGHAPAKWTELLEAAREDVRLEGSDRTAGLRLAKAVRAFDPPKPKRHVFGGVVFEETGEVREPDMDWYIFADGSGTIRPPLPRPGPDDPWVIRLKCVILRPLGLVGEVGCD